MNEPQSFEEYLKKNGSLTYTNVGVSMMPLLRQGRDLFTVREKGPGRCQKGDVVLYRRPPDRYVLHRIVEVRPKDYVILGDNTVTKEYVKDEDILGVMTGFVRGEKSCSTEDPAYRAYTAFILKTNPARVLFKKALLRLRRLIR